MEKNEVRIEEDRKEEKKTISIYYHAPKRLPLLPKLTSSIFSRSTARRFPCALTFASKVRSMAELVEDKEAGVAVVASGSGEGTEESKGLNRSHTFLDARTEEGRCYVNVCPFGFLEM
uniref:Uncharacterized protein n=1 Tax=Vitis vinifera TaxID=29760 RepID=A5C4K7_VITVI|nr:hypothetical protein VITISV_013998 [Vitis vinifera]